MKRFETGLFRRTQEILSQGESKQITFLIPLGDRRMPAPAALSSGNLGTPSLFVSGLLCVHMSVPSVNLSPVRHIQFCQCQNFVSKLFTEVESFEREGADVERSYGEECLLFAPFFRWALTRVAESAIEG